MLQNFTGCDLSVFSANEFSLVVRSLGLTIAAAPADRHPDVRNPLPVMGSALHERAKRLDGDLAWRLQNGGVPADDEAYSTAVEELYELLGHAIDGHYIKLDAIAQSVALPPAIAELYQPPDGSAPPDVAAAALAIAERCKLFDAAELAALRARIRTQAVATE